MKKSIGAKPLLVPMPVMVIATYDQHGRPNAMNAAWGCVASMEPPSVVIAVHPNRSTYENLLRRRAFTVNLPSESQVGAADYFGLASGHGVNKLDSAGLTSEPSKLVDAPMIADFPLSLECALTKTVEAGSHTLFIGEIRDIKADPEVMRGGEIILKFLKPVWFNPLSNTYHSLVSEPVAEAFSVGKSFLR